MPSPKPVALSISAPGLSLAHDGLKVAHLTDLHLGAITPKKRIGRAIDIANRFEPDLVVMTGDYLCYDARGLALVREHLAGLRAPVFCVLGNHDHWVAAASTRQVLEGMGYRVLQNQSETIVVRGAPLTVIGIDDLVTESQDVERAFEGVAPEISRIVLAHVPRTVELLDGQPGALLLSGHTHGGHVNLPFITRRFMGRENRYLAGLFEVGDWRLYVSRGIGGASFPLRVNAPAEVALLTLRSHDAQMEQDARAVASNG
ncbi:MAG: metallophosphoesterase [Myxococcales bacterium]|jgi:predicted MPP superfamily phosphohydrolase|nr:metallophosphoesterase [Myxococcales bacterium]